MNMLFCAVYVFSPIINIDDFRNKVLFTTHSEKEDIIRIWSFDNQNEPVVTIYSPKFFLNDPITIQGFIIRKAGGFEKITIQLRSNN